MAPNIILCVCPLSKLFSLLCKTPKQGSRQEDARTVTLPKNPLKILLQQFEFWLRSRLTEVLLCIKPDIHYNICCVQNTKQLPSRLDTSTASYISNHISHTDSSLIEIWRIWRLTWRLYYRKRCLLIKRANLLVSKGVCGQKPGLSDSGSIFATVLWVCSPCQKQQPNSITLQRLKIYYEDNA